MANICIHGFLTKLRHWQRLHACQVIVINNCLISQHVSVFQNKNLHFYGIQHVWLLFFDYSVPERKHLSKSSSHFFSKHANTEPFSTGGHVVRFIRLDADRSVISAHEVIVV